MPSDEFLGKRKKALEETFFAKQNQALVDELRQKRDREAARQALAGLAGIGDNAVLDRLIELEIGPDTWSAISLVPLVETAWADGDVDEKERRAVLAAAEANGAGPNSPGYQLLEGWLESRPGAELLESWAEYISALCETLSPADKAALKGEVLGRARAVAEAAGGILGFGNKVNDAEAETLAKLEKAFA